MPPLRLGVNIDHVATLRNARGGKHPDPIRAAKLAVAAGADGITAHLREDRRHIKDDDMKQLKASISVPLNFEMAPTEEMLGLALAIKPNAVCLVPEKREEITTEGGLNATGLADKLKPMIDRLKQQKIRVSLFIEADIAQIEASGKLGADIVEFHTGYYCHVAAEEREKVLKTMIHACTHAHNLGLECHAGHGLSYETVLPIARIPEIVELNIGHFIIGEAVFVGLESAIRKMKQVMDHARSTITP